MNHFLAAFKKRHKHIEQVIFIIAFFGLIIFYSTLSDILFVPVRIVSDFYSDNYNTSVSFINI